MKHGPRSVIILKRYFDNSFCVFSFLLDPWMASLRMKNIKVSKIYKVLGINIHGLKIIHIRSCFGEYCIFDLFICLTKIKNENTLYNNCIRVNNTL